MGQRHQIFVILPKKRKVGIEDFNNSEKKVKRNVIGVHHQWLYGVTAGNQALQFLKWNEKAMEQPNYVFGEMPTEVNPLEVIEALYSTNPKEGYASRCNIEPSYLSDDFTSGDNNDGITILDVSGDKPKYAMMFLWEHENGTPAFKPLNADEYMKAYYDLSMLEDKDSYYGDGDKDKEKSLRESCGYRAEIAKEMETYQVLTLKEIMTHFPKMKRNPSDELKKAMETYK